MSIELERRKIFHENIRSLENGIQFCELFGVSLLVVLSQVVHGCERELVFQQFLQLGVIRNDGVLVAQLVGEMEGQPIFEGGGRPLHRRLVRFHVHPHGKEAAGNVEPQRGVVQPLLRLLQQTLVLFQGSLVVAQVEATIGDEGGQPLRVRRLAGGSLKLVGEKEDRSAGWNYHDMILKGTYLK